ncbi:MAG TPA: TolC family protein [Bacteroidia bacterium]|nr:TolC family protein [Bacteroidia bacterium]HNS12051.1 TolC family protein [Bacteroidia bacterium]
MKKLILILLFIPLCTQLGAQTKDSVFSFTVKQAIAFALENQTDVQNAKLDAEISNAQVKEILGIGLPQLNGSFDVKDYEEIPTSLIPGEFFDGEAGSFIPVKFGTRWNATGTISATQLLFDPTYLIGVKATKTLRELSDKKLDRTELETAVAVAKAYYNVLLLTERKKAMDANLQRVQKLYDDTKVLNENGFVEKLDLDRVKVALNNASTEIEKFSRLLIVSNKILKYQMGMKQSAVLEPIETINAAELKNLTISLEKYDISERIEYSILETQKKLQEYNVKRYRSGRYPNLIAYGNLSTTAQRQEFNFFDSDKGWYPVGIIGATLSLPLFDGFQKHNKIKQEKLNLRKLENEIERFEEAASVEVSSNRDALINSVNSLNVQEQNLELANDIYSTSKLKYDQGVGSNLEVLDAETSLKDSQANYFNALYDVMISKIDLEKSMGKFIY